MRNDRLQQQIDFIIEIENLKHVYRQTFLTNSFRHKDETKRSWNLAMMAILLCEHATDMPIDMFRVVRMLLIHGIVEIDTGDLLHYNECDFRTHKARENEAAEHFFGLLHNEQAREFRALWQEFEAQETPESHFAASIDRLQPLLHNDKTTGYTWKKHTVSSGKPQQRVRTVQNISPTLWKLVEELIQGSVQKGYLHPN